MAEVRLFILALIITVIIVVLGSSVVRSSFSTVYYVDPDFGGSVKNGSASNPWSYLDNTAWNTINDALSQGNVTVYFSAREASSDIGESYNSNLNVLRNDTSTNRLTLDGMSKYNSNNSNPSWQDYSGNSKFKLIGQYSLGLGWYSNDIPEKRNYITMRGFDVSGSEARITFGGSHDIVEYIHIHDTTDIGATIQFDYAVNATCDDLGKDTDVVVRNNLIERTFGEGIYIGSNYMRVSDGGCPSYGNTHSNIVIENNTIIDTGINGQLHPQGSGDGQGDGIDLKAGLMNVTVRNNLIENTHFVSGGTDYGADGIVAEGVFPGPSGNYLIENNTIINASKKGINLAAQNGTTIRNNIIYNSRLSGIAFIYFSPIINTNLMIYNNIIVHNGVNSNSNLHAPGIELNYYSNSTFIENNILADNSCDPALTNCDAQVNLDPSSTPITSDYNLQSHLYSFYEGTHSIMRTNSSGFLTDPANGNFHPGQNSPAVDNGTNLSSTGFNYDMNGVPRPQGSAWDIGAYEYVSGTQLNPADINGDQIISSFESLNYTLYYKKQLTWPVPPNPIDASNWLFQRLLFKRGGNYTIIGSGCPPSGPGNCWNVV